MEKLVGARIFLPTGQWYRQFWGQSVHFYGYSCCMIFFFAVKVLQEIFSQIFHTPHPLQRSNGPPLKLISLVCQNFDF